LVHLDADKGEVKRAWRFGDTFAQDVLGLESGGSPSSLFLLARTTGTIDFGGRVGCDGQVSAWKLVGASARSRRYQTSSLDEAKGRRHEQRRGCPSRARHPQRATRSLRQAKSDLNKR